MTKVNKYLYGSKCFGLPEEQIKTFDELTSEQQERAYYYFGKADVGRFIYCIKKNGELVWNRERIRPEWS